MNESNELNECEGFTECFFIIIGSAVWLIVTLIFAALVILAVPLVILSPILIPIILILGLPFVLPEMVMDEYKEWEENFSSKNRTKK